MTFSIVTLKAFGDFVIACHSARAARMQSPVTIHHPAVIAGEYMRPLAAALGVESEVAFIGSKQWTDVPAVFDVRKRGIAPALHSLIELRAILKKFPQDREFVFDNAGIREFFLCPHRKLHHIPKASGNIYLGYQQFFQSAPKPASHPFSFTSVKKVILIPGSRVASKVIPKSVIDTIHHILAERGHSLTVVTLEGESIDFSKGIHSVCIPRTFDNLIATIRASDWMIAADSLPSHIGEYFQIPQFIFTPHTINFMLPQSVHESGAWAMFNDSQKLAHWLDAHP